MPEKRKKDVSGGKNSKKARGSKDEDRVFSSYMMSNFTADVLDPGISRDSSDDSDGDVGGSFQAFDLPNFDAFGDESEPPEEEKPANGSQGVIFVSDPSQLPKPISFSTPTMMNPVVIGGSGAQKQPMMMVGPQSSSSAGKLVSHVKPAVLPAKPSTSSRRQTTDKVSPMNKLTATMMAQASSSQAQANKGSRGGAPVRTIGSLTTKSPTARGAAPGASMTATTIMQQVMAAAQQAAKNIRAASSPRQAASARPPPPRIAPRQAPPRGPAPNILQRNSPNFRFPNVRGRGRVQQVQRPGSMQNFRAPSPMNNRRPQTSPRTLASPRNQTSPMPRSSPIMNGNSRNQQQSPDNSAKKWKPYSDILNRLSKKLSRESAQRLGIGVNSNLNLKQMYSFLRSKFSTNQIFDMCLWDMEHQDASLLEIAITNAFS